MRTFTYLILVLNLSFFEYGVFHIQKRKVQKNNIWLRSKERNWILYRYIHNMPTITQLLRNIRQPKKNGKKSPALKGCPQRRGTCARVYVRLVQIMNSNR